MKIKEIFRPSILISEVFYPYVDQDEQLTRIVKWAAQLNYYRGIEIGAVYDASNRKEVRSILEQNDIQLTSWATRDLCERNLMPASLEPAVRQKTDERLKELLAMAAECGAVNFCLISGPDPGIEKREEAKDVFFETVCRIMEQMRFYEGMNLMIEPLDRFAHKKGLIGPTDESLEFMKRVRKEHGNCYFSWDSAHVALNEENLADSIEVLSPYIGQIHLANAVLDHGSDLYGDWHMKVGEPGFLTERTGYEILNTASKAKLPDPAVHFVSVEVRGGVQEDLLLGESRIRNYLDSILEQEVIA